jgi:hypothetical protein
MPASNLVTGAFRTGALIFCVAHLGEFREVDSATPFALIDVDRIAIPTGPLDRFIAALRAGRVSIGVNALKVLK